MSDSNVAGKYRKRYRQGVINRDNDLKTYNHFLMTLGEFISLEQLVGMANMRKDVCRILDIGCGNAQALGMLKKEFGPRVFVSGIDLLPPAVELDGFIEGNIHAVNFPKKFDLIISFRSLHEMGGLENLIPKIASSLAPKGRAYLWIRIREIVSGKPIFTGEMNEKEEAFLFSLSSQRELHGVKILAQPVYEPLPGAKSVVTGFTVVMLNTGK
jgi:SAM-dependent methyltransferase